ncbi:MAG: carboxypeptidase-like regulatory domain-containing protein [Terriglobales bacterium]
MIVLRLALILLVFALLCSCSRHRATEAANDWISVCGTAIGEDRLPVSKALIELHELPKDTPDDAIANRYEIATTNENGRFRLAGVVPDRQYWLTIEGKAGCTGLTMSERESKRLPIAFRRRSGDRECQDSINVLLDLHCNLKVQ